LLKQEIFVIKDFVIERVRTFQAKAGSLFGQKEAEAIWKEDSWKLGLQWSELKALQDGWASFVVNGDRKRLDEASEFAITRLSK